MEKLDWFIITTFTCCSQMYENTTTLVYKTAIKLTLRLYSLSIRFELNEKRQ